jgi:hypothetical protein
MTDLELPDGDWLEALKPFQQSHLKTILAKEQDPEKVVLMWLSAQGASNTSPFGGTPKDTKPFYDLFMIEIQKVICGSPDYEATRKDIKDRAAGAKTVIISMISSAIAVKLGIIAALITPVVALVLSAAAAAGHAAWCSSRPALPAANNTAGLLTGETAPK